EPARPAGVVQQGRPGAEEGRRGRDRRRPVREVRHPAARPGHPQGPVTLDYDVVVVGAGGGGLAAALTAAGAGARAPLLGEARQVGGTTRLAIGSITAAGTAQQERGGIADTWQALDEDLDLFAGALLPRDNVELRRRLAREAAPTLRWLMDLGVPFVGPYQDL